VSIGLNDVDDEGEAVDREIVYQYLTIHQQRFQLDIIIYE
jgi:hypothetical protein